MNHEQIEVGKFLFIQDWPDEFTPTMRELAEEFQWLVPPWCHYVTIAWHPKNPNAMDCTVDVAYRNIRLRLGPSFFDDSSEHRREIFIHELIHGFIAGLADYATNAVKRILSDENDDVMKKLILEDLNERHEQATNDLAFVLSRKL